MTSLPVPPVDPLAALRAATGSLHAQLDASVPLSRPGATLADYLLHLRMLLRWFDSIGPVLQALPAEATAAPDLAALRRLAEGDLRLGGQEPTESRAAAGAGALPPAAGVTDQPLAAAWGVAYVLAGSQLGGQMLYRRLQAPLSPHPLHYLAGTGLPADPGTRWKAFMAALRGAVATPEATAAATAAAVAAFESLVALFAAEGVEATA